MYRAAGVLLAWMILLCALAAAVYGIAGNGGLLAEEMRKNAPPETTGLPAAEYGAVGQMTADYLTGRAEVFQHTFSDDSGTVYQCFQPHEASHMADCRALIRLAGTLRWVCGGTVLMLAGAGVMIRRIRKDLARGVLTGLAVAGVIVAALLVWGLADFDGLFTAFHRLVFTNEGWLLDPRTDLLIRLMPTGLFTDLGIRILLWLTGAAAAAAGAAIWITHHDGCDL